MTALDTPPTAARLPRHDPRPGSLLSEVAQSGDVLLVFPGVQAGWPAALDAVLKGRPWLEEWLTDVAERVARWTHTPDVQDSGWFARDIREILTPTCDAGTAAQAPFALAGSVLANLASLAALEADGGHVLTSHPSVRVTGHSAGLISAAAAGGGPEAAAGAVELALLLGITATDVAGAAGAAASPAALTDIGPDTQPSPMAAVRGPRRDRLEALLRDFGPGVELALANGLDRHVLSGAPGVLRDFRTHLQTLAGEQAAAHKAGRRPGAVLDFEWEPLPNAVPFHHSALAPAASSAAAWARRSGIRLVPRLTILDSATGRVLDPQCVLDELATSVLSRPQDWAGTLLDAVTAETVVISLGVNQPVHGLTEQALRGSGALVLRAESGADRRTLTAPGATLPQRVDYSAYQPVRHGDRIVTKHTRLTGRSPFILAGMTPTTVDAGIVAAAANAGHVAELAGGGQVSEPVFDERMAELAELLEPGQEVVFNAMHLDPYLWGLHLGTSRLVQRARAAGAPLCGVTISAGIPERDDALELLEELHGLGLWLNAFKPGSVKQVLAALEIAEATDRPLWLHLEGGQAGGHHSWENLEDLLLATYDRVRSHDNVVLAVGGGVGTPERAEELLTGQWSRKYGAPAMPVDAVLIGTAAMACRESTASRSVKQVLAAIDGPESGWVRRAEFAGEMTSGLSGLNADIHFVDNSASRAAALLDEVAGDLAAVTGRRDEIVSALASTAKPYFGDVARMTYTGLLQRFAELTALGDHGRYHDGAWLDPTHRSRFRDLLQRAEARLHKQDSGRIPTLFGAPESVDDPATAIAALCAAHPQADSVELHPADVDFFAKVCRAPGKPVPFVPVIDAEVRRWYQSDALWQSHDERFDADQVLIIPGPAAVAGIQVPDEPVAALFDRFETWVVRDLPPRADANVSPVAAVLNAPTVQWAGRTRPNPVRNLAPAGQWDLGPVAVYTRGEEYARLIPVDATRVDLEIGWPALADGDGTLVLPLEVRPLARGVLVVVTPEALAAAGRQVPVAAAPDVDGAAAHAATVAAGVRLPDAAMRSIWPGVFEAFAAAIPDGLLDLVHLEHRIETAAGPQETEVAGVGDAPGGYRITTRAGTAGARSTDTFFVRQPGAAPQSTAMGEHTGAAWRDTPSLLLGSITQAAPAVLDTFARVTGDLNPIHRSELVARLAGLPGRIVHGMWTSAVGQRAAVELAADGSAQRLRDWHIKFLAPLLPGAEVTASVRRTGAAHGDLRVEVVLAAGDTTVATAVATVAPPRTAYVFPGQGVQQVGMGMDGYDRSQAARDVWDSADAHCRQALGFSILQVVRDNPTILVAGVPGDGGAQQTYRHPAGVLFLTQFTQVAMATLACAQVAELRERGVFDETAVTAGHSVGEYNALAAVTGTLPLPDLLELVFARGSAMHDLVPRAADGSSQYRLAVVRPHLAGLDHAGADDLVRTVADDTGELCEIVNHNLKGKQYAVAGTVAALAELERRIGPGSGKPPFLLVPGIDVPFHSSALTDGVVAFRSHLERRLPETIDPAALVGRYVPNLYPQPFATTRGYVAQVLRVCGSAELQNLLAQWDELTEAQVARTLLIELLAWQFAMPVRWIETTDVLCSDLGVQQVVEVGVGTQPTLANLFKGALALGSHRGTRPVVLHAEADLAEVLELTEDPVIEEAPLVAEAPQPEVSQRPAPAAASGAPQPDLPVTHADALAALVAARTSLRPEQLQDESIEDLVDGASSRRNQLLMDLGKEFGVSGMDGVHEVALSQVAEGLAGKAVGYRFPGPVLRTWLDAESAAALGRIGGSPASVPARVRDHWGLGDGWAAQAMLVIALGSREGTSKRGGDLRTLTGDNPQGLVDAAVEAVAAHRGLFVSPVSAVATPGLDASAVAEVTGAIEDLLADTATTVLRRLDRLPAAPEPVAAPAGPDALTVEYGGEHAEQIAPSFDPRRHVHLGSATTWARAEVDHLVQAIAAGRPLSELADSVDQIAAHREADPRIAATLRWYAGRSDVFGGAADEVASAVEVALAAGPAGIGPALTPALAALPTTPDLAHLGQVAERLAQQPGPFADEVALVTGASPGSIALAAVAHLLRGGATVVLVTSSDDEQRIAQYRDLERTCAGPGAELHVIRANLASFTDIDRLQEWLTTPATQTVGGLTKQTKPALWPTLVLPFAAGPALGSLADTDAHNAATLRLMLLGVQRLVGGLGERILAAGRPPARVILPMSPNHGTFGGDGSYGDSKAALETVLNRWHAEQSAWAAGTRLVAATIGWVRGTGLMAGNDRIADAAGQALGIHVFTAEQMGALIAAACAPELAQFAERPWRLDLTGGLAGAGDISAVMRDLAGTVSATPATEDDEGMLDALPCVPWAGTRAVADSFDVEPVIGLDDMVVIAGIAELGPWGASRTRWEAEVGTLSADAVTELAWRMGLITWDPQSAGWLDVDGTPADEAQIRELLHETVAQRAGLREFETTAGVAADGTLNLAEVYLDAPVSIAGVTYPAGTAIRVPGTRPLQRQVGGQFPTGADPVRHGLDRSVAESIDPLAAWNLVVSAEALADAGTSAQELAEHVHPGRIGNVQGTGMGGMDSLHKLYVDPLLGAAHANDLLQEALGNVVSAHTNQSLLGGYGPMVHPVAACATAAVSLEEAVDKIRVGKADILLAGGWDDLSSEGINGFADMAATADNQELIAAGIGPRGHSRPGDRRRAGFVESQGGGSFLVMRGSVALRLGLPVRAVVAYAGSFGDGLHTSIPAPGLGTLNAARGGPGSMLAQALREHGLTTDDISVVSKHDTSTHANDPNEALIHATIQEALGRCEGAPLRVISQKSVTGHAKGGAAAWQLAGLCDVFATGVIPGNRNLVGVDPQVTPGPLVVDYRPLQRREPVRAAVLTSLGFGHVSALVALAHPAVFLAAVPEHLREGYLRRSAARRLRGQRALLAARYGGPPVFVRRTRRPARTEEIDLLIGVNG